MKSATFSIAPRTVAVDIENGSKDGLFGPERLLVLQTTVHIRKTNGLICGNVSMSVFLTILAAISVFFTTILGRNSSSWFFIVTALDVLGIIGYVSANITIVTSYLTLLVAYIMIMIDTLLGIAILGVEPISEVFTFYHLDALSRYCFNPDAVAFLITFSIFMAVRIYITYKYIEFVTFTKLFLKLKSQNYVLEAQCGIL